MATAHAEKGSLSREQIRAKSIGAYRLRLRLILLRWPSNSRPSTSTAGLFAYFTMHLWQTALPFCLLASALPTVTASAWGFADATVAVQPKGAGVKGGFKEQYDRVS